jgi:hypothetical protein
MPFEKHYSDAKKKSDPCKQQPKLAAYYPRRSPMSTKLDGVNAIILTRMENDGVEDTTANRVLYLKTLQEELLTGRAHNCEKALFAMVVHNEIHRLEGL